MRVPETANSIYLDLDRDRIKTVIREAYSYCKQTLGVDFTITEDDFVANINPFLDSNRVSLPVTLPLPSRKYPELCIEVNLRRKGVFARMINRKKQAQLNYYLTQL